MMSDATNLEHASPRRRSRRTGGRWENRRRSPVARRFARLFGLRALRCAGGDPERAVELMVARHGTGYGVEPDLLRQWGRAAGLML